jgi:hypothetical protein
MNAKLDVTTGRCPFCPAKGTREQTVFLIKSDIYNGRACGEHLASLISQAKEEQQTPQNGQPAHESV